MKTSISIPKELLDQLARWSNTGSRNEAIKEAIKAYVKSKQRAAAAANLGTFQDFMNHKELERLRDDR